jgi:ADP-ribose pyrophosphatase YjhB (NUDIX family)
MEQDYLKNNPLILGEKEFLQNVSIDNVIFGYHEKELKVLLQKPQGLSKWLLPGGYIKKTEEISAAAERIAKERTGLDNLFLLQFKSFGKPDRLQDPAFTPESLSKLSNMNINAVNWLFEYHVSVCFYTLTEFSKVNPKGDFYSEQCSWWGINEIPDMLFDHRLIITEALKSLRLHLYHYPIGLNLLPKKFTLPEIHALYETILDRELDSRNFSKKLIKTGIIKKLTEKKSIGAHRSPFLYKFDNNVYKEALENGMALII